jgi:1A family penicillin-binding protein
MLKKLLKFALFIFVVAIISIIGLVAYFAKDLPDPSKISQRQIVESTKIYDRTGKIILYDIHDEEKRTVIDFEKIPKFVKDATIVIEDDNFYHHLGLDWRGILRAAWSNLTGKEISQGGSTITQQFIKNAYLGGPNSERTFTRKIKEAILALLMERKYSKDEILEFYLNQVPYGSNAYGIEAASQTFFEKSVPELTLAESALLAALPQAPSYYSPYGSHPKELEERQQRVLERMAEFNYINQEQLEQAKEEKLEYASQSDLKAHHFIAMIKEYLEEKYSRTYTDINMAGLKVYTTLDWELQEIAEQAVAEGVEKNKENYRATNAALVAIDPKTGQVLALVGSKRYEEDQFNVATSPYRQPGSSFKPFAYAVAFEKGYTPETILFDLQTSFGKFGPGNGKDYSPNNYDLKFRGPITMRQSLAQSVNLTSVKTLYLAGIQETIDLAQDMGITTLKDRGRYNLSLVLGGGEIKLLDETAAYGIFANEGIKHPTNLIIKIEDAQGNILEERKDKETRVLSQQVARQISNILSDESARAPMMGSYSKLYLPGIPAAAKTGTTQDYSDGWTIGYTPSLVAGVWAGNNDFKDKMRLGAAGLYVAAPIWNDFMLKAYEAKKSEMGTATYFEELSPFLLPGKTEYFTPPEISEKIEKPMLNGQIAFQNKIEIDKISGKLATDLTPPDLIEEKIYQEAHSILYYVDKTDPLGDYPENPAEDSQFQNWETSVLEWARSQPCNGQTCYNRNIISQYDDIHILENQPEVEIKLPKKNSSISEPTLFIQASAQAKLGIKQVDFFFNDNLVGTDTTQPYSITISASPYLIDSDRQTIKVRAYDQVLNRQEDEITIHYQ